MAKQPWQINLQNTHSLFCVNWLQKKPNGCTLLASPASTLLHERWNFKRAHEQSSQKILPRLWNSLNLMCGGQFLEGFRQKKTLFGLFFIIQCGNNTDENINDHW